MPRVSQSLRQQQRDLSDDLRAQQLTWIQIAEEFCGRYGVNIRAALRMVRDWSQRDAAERWNLRWPADPKTFKNFSYWELWPSSTGHAPSLDVLARLAELYECSIADLVSDCADFRKLDNVYRATGKLAGFPVVAASELSGGSAGNSSFVELVDKLESMDTHEIVRIISAWGKQSGAGLKRRALLLKLSAALTLAATTPAFAEEPDDTAVSDSMLSGDLNGIWHSWYKFTSTGRGKDFIGQHYVAMQHRGDHFFGESLPVENGSKIRLDFTLSGSVATGTWTERTSPSGYYRGSTYHGGLQLVIDPMGKTMRGKWVGFDRHSQVQSDKWELNWMQRENSKSIQRQFHFRA